MIRYVLVIPDEDLHFTYKVFVPGAMRNVPVPVTFAAVRLAGAAEIFTESAEAGTVVLKLV